MYININIIIVNTNINTIKKKSEVLLDASREVDVELNTKKTKYKLM
jgi:hypothetical protein